MTNTPDFDVSVDYLVLGSGGAGMFSAVVAHDAGLESLVVEKDELFGGTTAMSGGVVWIPNNHLKAKSGLDDSDEKALRFLNSVLGDEADPVKLDTYIKYAKVAVRYMDEKTDAGWLPHPTFMDYFPENEGGTPGGRSLDPKPINGKQLGDELQFMQANAAKIMGRFRMTAAEGKVVVAMNLKSYWLLAKILLRYFLDIPSRLRRLPDARLTNGSALAGGLRLSMKKRGIPLWLKSPARELIMEGGRVIGAVIEREGKTCRVQAKKGVLMSTGGFGHNQALRDKYQVKSANADWSLSTPQGEGDAVAMGESIGAALDNMSAAWWTPILRRPNGENEFFLASRGMPHSIMVNQNGERFLNEAGSYDEVGKQIHAENEKNSAAIPCYFIIDGTYRRNSPLGMQIPPAKVMPDSLLPKEYFDSGWLKKADTLAELAHLIGVDAGKLQATVDRFNGFAKSGKDEDFHRGDSLHDHFFANTKIRGSSGGPNPGLGVIAEAPFYAVEVYPGDLDTKGGLKTDEHARVLNQQGEVIPGLYAAGNCSASMMGNFYPAGGTTIGPALTFGFIAAKFASGQLN